MIAFAGGLLDLCYPLGKYFDVIYNPTFGAELGWAYDIIRNEFKKKRYYL